MANPLFNKFGNNQSFGMRSGGNNGILGLINQYRQIQNDPGRILDILLNSGKINQQQYNDLQSVRNNPQQIINYLSMNGNVNQLNQASQMANQVMSQLNKGGV